MQFDFTTLPAEDRYRLLTNFVGPRPIALVTTRSSQGIENAAPMSFFNVVSHAPPLVVIGFSALPDGREKDTLCNIRETDQFCVNMVDLPLADQMILCGVNLEPTENELDYAGLATAPCAQIDTARLTRTPCAMECRTEHIIDYPGRAIVLGNVVQMHVRPDCLDREGRYVDPTAYQPIARLHADTYIVSDRQFELRKPSHLGSPNAPSRPQNDGEPL